MVVPALLYASLNAGRAGAPGWGVPMATDIAFALGVLALLGDRVPLGVRVFLAALAIVDDIGAVLVIALFYSGGIAWGALAMAGALLLLAIGANVAGVRRPWAYGAIGLALWAAVFASGVHATIAGVLLAMTIPARTDRRGRSFCAEARRALAALRGRARGERFGASRPGAPGRGPAAGAARPSSCSRRSSGSSTRCTGWSRSGSCRSSRSPTPACLWGSPASMPRCGMPGGAGRGARSRAGKAARHHALLAWLAVRLGLPSLPEGVSWRSIGGADCSAGSASRCRSSLPASPSPASRSCSCGQARHPRRVGDRGRCRVAGAQQLGESRRAADSPVARPNQSR